MRNFDAELLFSLWSDVRSKAFSIDPSHARWNRDFDCTVLSILYNSKWQYGPDLLSIPPIRRSVDVSTMINLSHQRRTRAPRALVLKFWSFESDRAAIVTRKYSIRGNVNLRGIHMIPIQWLSRIVRCIVGGSIILGSFRLPQNADAIFFHLCNCFEKLKGLAMTVWAVHDIPVEGNYVRKLGSCQMMPYQCGVAGFIKATLSLTLSPETFTASHLLSSIHDI